VLTRRSFLATVGALATAAACRKSGPAQQAASQTTRRRLDRIGIQLYSVRTEMQRDMPGTLARLAQIGYKEVEFAGYNAQGRRWSNQELRGLLSKYGLTAIGSHVSYTSASYSFRATYEMVRDNFDKTADDAQAVGHQFLTVPFLGNAERVSATSWRKVAADFNRAGERAKARGMRFSYHNHDFEFKSVDGILPFDLLLAETDPSLVSFQMDVYWTTMAGGDPLAYFRQHPARFSSLHIKDSAGPPDHKQTDVGAGTIDFAAIFRLDASQQSSVKHAFVEHDQPPDPMAFAKASFDYLSRLEY
jgi:sugar phosphate isomerase/epimerase